MSQRGHRSFFGPPPPVLLLGAVNMAKIEFFNALACVLVTGAPPRPQKSLGKFKIRKLGGGYRIQTYNPI